MDTLVRPILRSDYDDILRINTAALPHVARLDEVELHRLVSLARVAWVAGTATSVHGYLLAMSSTDDYDGEEFRSFRQRLDRPFVYIDQIAVDRNARRARVASHLYGALAQWSRQHELLALCCEINVRPPNPASARFHEKLGFGSLGEMETADGRLVELLSKPTTGPSIAT